MQTTLDETLLVQSRHFPLARVFSEVNVKNEETRTSKSFECAFYVNPNTLQCSVRVESRSGSRVIQTNTEVSLEELQDDFSFAEYIATNADEAGEFDIRDQMHHEPSVVSCEVDRITQILEALRSVSSVQLRRDVLRSIHLQTRLLKLEANDQVSDRAVGHSVSYLCMSACA